eukprot:TRINITY_DN11673_c0_g1_i1.p1 TRINITY_DN11673_c0_g1~~TRINITY_DN11673_c0_g1_i1.p1  ORF type:complete len:340 (-),score=66.84 TRINITY_DN11673_c0_g1_i1:178-1197(-)
MATFLQSCMDCAGMPAMVAGEMIMDAKWYENTRKFHKLPSDYGMKYEDVKFQALDGCQLSAWYIPSKDPSLKKLAIVGHQSWSEANRSGCLDHTKHGMMAVEGIDYVKLHKVFHDEGYHVLAYDLRNHGESEHKLPGGWGEIEFQDAAGVMDFVNSHSELKDCKLCLATFCVSGQSFLKANSLYPEKFKNLKAFVTTNLFQGKYMFCNSTLGMAGMPLCKEHVDREFKAKQDQYIEQGLLKENKDIQMSVDRLSATMYAKDMKVPVLYCDPKNDWGDNHPVSAPEIFKEFPSTKSEFHWIGKDQPAPFTTTTDNRSQGYSFYQSEAGSKILTEFLKSHV